MCGDGHAGCNLTEVTESCQVVRFVSREAFMEPVDLQVFVIVGGRP